MRDIRHYDVYVRVLLAFGNVDDLQVIENLWSSGVEVVEFNRELRCSGFDDLKIIGN